ncbi:MAG: methionine--tRNA ligase [Planctomycetota bacterium]
MYPRKLLVTAALPYANGPIHIGHLVEYIQTDIWVRFQKLRGHRCIFMCADDTHGTAIMMRARQEGRTEEELITRMQEAHLRDFHAFDIEFDNYGSTNSPENRRLCGEVWQAIRRADLVIEEDVDQLYDPREGMFLADRFVKGTCPKCHSPEQYGDNCDKCGSTYRATELISPVSTLSGAQPEVRRERHLFIQLEKLHAFLEEWTQTGGHLQVEVANYLKGHFLNAPLRDWDVSRPAPYFGFEIPDSPGNYWYVWFDAPIGYMASTQQWCDRTGERLEDWWRSDDVEIHHFIGKDITYFHTLFWPGMLKAAGFSLPTKVRIHGFLTVGGEKMSKRKGTFVMAQTYARHLDPAYLRYYYASKLGPRLEDIDLNFDEFVFKGNADLIGKVVNLASRSAKFVHSIGLSSSYPDDGGLFQRAADRGEEIAAAYEQGDYNRAVRMIMDLADQANPYVEAAEPWKLAKDPDQAQKLQDVCTVALNLFRQLVIYLTPVLPRLAAQTGELLGRPIEQWDESKTPLTGTPVARFQHMLKRVDKKDVSNMIDESKAPESQESPAASNETPSPTLAEEPLAEECTIDDFAKVDLRVARVLSAEDVPQANKLLKITVSLGGDETRTVFAGIKQAYRPEQLVDRLVVIAANLAPRKMKFGTSEGMILASGPGGSDVFLLSVDEGAKPGQRVH